MLTCISRVDQEKSNSRLALSPTRERLPAVGRRVLVLLLIFIVNLYTEPGDLHVQYKAERRSKRGSRFYFN